MHVTVLGAGVSGITTAYYLSELGHDVTVIERDGAVATGTSHANGGQLAYSYVDAMANPVFAARLPRIILGFDSASRFRFGAGLKFAAWGLRFLRHCTSGKAKANTLALLQLAMRSAANMDALRRVVPVEFNYRSRGKLVMLRSARELDEAQRSAELKLEHGCETEVISIASARVLEPALANMRENYTAAAYAKGDHTGDAAKFTINLAEWLQRKSRIQLRLREAAQKLVIRNRRVVAVTTLLEEIPTDAVVVCLGVWSDELLRPLGIKTGICPIRGYSMTLPLGSHTPTLSVTDPERRIVFTRLGDTVRVAGFADFIGFKIDKDPKRTAKLLELAKKIGPEAADYAAERRNRWGGFRPMTPDGRPRVGATKVPGLFLNTGHGSLGWTLACATAEDVARLISDNH